jgi:hypothetical protein
VSPDHAGRHEDLLRGAAEPWDPRWSFLLASLSRHLAPTSPAAVPRSSARTGRGCTQSRPLALNKTFLRLSQNPSTGDAGTCYGDSRGTELPGRLTRHRVHHDNRGRPVPIQERHLPTRYALGSGVPRPIRDAAITGCPPRHSRFEQISAGPATAVGRGVCDEVSFGNQQCGCEVLEGGT